MDSFEIIPKLYIGDNAIENLKHELTAKKFENVFLVCSKHGFSSNAMKDTIAILKELKIQYFIYQINENVADSNEIYEASMLFNKKKSKLIIVIGSNTAIDFAKLLAIYAPNKSIHHSVWHYINDPNYVKSIGYPIVCIPLNFSTGSCSNGLSLIYNEKMKIAQGVASFTSTPNVVIMNAKYMQTISKDELKQALLFCVLDCINNILNNNHKNWFWTENYNYGNLISIIRAIIAIKQNYYYEDAWKILMTNSFFSGTSLSKYHSEFAYELLSLFLGINGITRKNFTLIMNQLFFVYLEVKRSIDEQFKLKIINLNKKLFNKETDEISLLKQYLEQILDLSLHTEPLIADENIANKMVENAIIQFQKNYLDIININKEQYQQKQDKATELFIKIIYQFINKKE